MLGEEPSPAHSIAGRSSVDDTVAGVLDELISRLSPEVMTSQVLHHPAKRRPSGTEDVDVEIKEVADVVEQIITRTVDDLEVVEVLIQDVVQNVSETVKEMDVKMEKLCGEDWKHEAGDDAAQNGTFYSSSNSSYTDSLSPIQTLIKEEYSDDVIPQNSSLALTPPYSTRGSVEREEQQNLNNAALMTSSTKSTPEESNIFPEPIYDDCQPGPSGSILSAATRFAESLENTWDSSSSFLSVYSDGEYRNSRNRLSRGMRNSAMDIDFPSSRKRRLGGSGSGSHKRVRIDADGKVAVLKCEWADCSVQEESIDDLYDHVMKTHMSELRELEQKISSGEMEMPGSSANEDDNDNENEDDEEDDNEADNLFGCQWGKCDMALTRGSFERKFKWLEEHYRTRHARGARPFFCLIDGCDARFSSTKQVDDHVRITHVQKTHEQKHHHDDTALKRMIKPVKFPRASHPYYDTYWHIVMLRRLLSFNKNGYLGREAPLPRLTGAAKRKTRGSAVFNPELFVKPRNRMITSAESSTKASFNAEAEEQLTFDELFPSEVQTSQDVYKVRLLAEVAPLTKDVGQVVPIVVPANVEVSQIIVKTPEARSTCVTFSAPVCAQVTAEFKLEPPMPTLEADMPSLTPEADDTADDVDSCYDDAMPSLDMMGPQTTVDLASSKEYHPLPACSPLHLDSVFLTPAPSTPASSMSDTVSDVDSLSQHSHDHSHPLTCEATIRKILSADRLFTFVESG